MKTRIRHIAWLLLLPLCPLSVAAQHPEPDYPGDGYYLRPGDMPQSLERKSVALKTKVSYEEITALDENDCAFVDSIEVTKACVELKGAKSYVRLPEARLTLLIRAHNNKLNPVSTLKVFRFEQRGARRYAAVRWPEHWETYAGSVHLTEPGLERVQYLAKVYGEHSYHITLEGLEPGEYGVLIVDLDKPEPKRLKVSCFGVDPK